MKIRGCLLIVPRWFFCLRCVYRSLLLPPSDPTKSVTAGLSLFVNLCKVTAVLTGRTVLASAWRDTARHWQSDKIVYVHNPLSCFPPLLGRGLLQWLFQMRKPEAAAPVAVRQLMAVWLSPHCALFKLRGLRHSPLQLGAPSKLCLNHCSYPQSFCFDLVKFYHRAQISSLQWAVCGMHSGGLGTRWAQTALFFLERIRLMD